MCYLNEKNYVVLLYYLFMSGLSPIFKIFNINYFVVEQMTSRVLYIKELYYYFVIRK